MGAKTFNGTIEKMTDFHQDIITLHNIARNIENKMGSGKLSEDIRRAADRLNTLVSKQVPKPDLTYNRVGATAVNKGK
jgi:hypothetical protein